MVQRPNHCSGSKDKPTEIMFFEHASTDVYMAASIHLNQSLKVDTDN